MEWDNLKSTSPIRELIIAYLITEGNDVSKQWVIEYVCSYGFIESEVKESIDFLHQQGKLTEYISESDGRTSVLKYRQRTSPFYCNMSNYPQLRMIDFTGRVFQADSMGGLIQINSDTPKAINAHSWIGMFIMQKLEIACCVCLYSPLTRIEAIASPICKKCKTALVNLPLPPEYEYIYLVRFLRKIKETRILAEDLTVLKMFLKDL